MALPGTDRRRTAATAVVLLTLLLAGCNGGGTTTVTPTGGASSPPEAAPTTTTVRTPGAATPTTVPSPTATVAATPTGTDVVDGAALEASHLERLRSAGSFTTSTTVVRTLNATARVNRTTSVDLEAERALQTSVISNSRSDARLGIDTFTTSEVTYERLRTMVGGGEITRYRAQAPPYNASTEVTPVNVTDALNVGLVASIGDDVSWTRAGEDRFRGVPVTRFEAEGADDFEGMLSSLGAGTDAEATRVESVEGTLLVDGDGVVRYFSFAFVGVVGDTPLRYEFTITTSEIGTTTVDDPGWLDEARSETTPG